MIRTICAVASVLLPGLLLVGTTAWAAPPATCGDADDPFSVYYGQQGVGKQWLITMVSPDHEGHGMHMSEGDAFTLKADENCAVIMMLGANLQQRWGASHQALGRESKALDHTSISNELCTTMSLGHGSAGAIARPHLVRMRTIDSGGTPVVEIKYGHRSTMNDDCSNDGLLDSIHGGTAHAEN